MKIGEIEKDSILIVKVFSKMIKDGEEVRSPKSLDFPVKLQNVYPTGLAVDEIKTVVLAGDKGEESTFTVAFDSPNVLIDLYLLKDDMPPVVWEDVTIKKAKGDNGYCHVIIPSKDGIKMNRRHAYRLEIHAPANLVIGQGTEPLSGIIRDVSATGFAIITNKDGIRRGESVRAETLNQELSMPLAGVCVRKQTIAKDKFLYGCKLKYEDPNLRKFINEKQRERMKTE